MKTITITIPAEDAERAQEYANIQTGGNLSLFMAALIRREVRPLAFAQENVELTMLTVPDSDKVCRIEP